MSTPARPDPLRHFEAFVDTVVRFPMPRPVDEKINAVERLIEQWRIGRHSLVNALEFEEFLDWKWFIDGERVHFAPAASHPEKGFGTTPIRLQRKLLAFLVLHHGRDAHVLKIIETFVAQIRPSLETVDFKKTKTGVFRCFTNTRFAANKLREHGLLKFTRREAFKTWVLSLAGFIVAARALASPDWTLPTIRKDSWHDLDPFILSCCDAVADYETFVATLRKICQPNAEVFTTFASVLADAHRLLQEYWAALQDQNLSKAERAKVSRELIERLDAVHGYGEFLEELAACIQVEDILKQADDAAKQS